MKILYLDTSSKFLSLAVAEDAKVLSRLHRSLGRRHSTKLALLIDKILKKAKISLKKLDGFCVSRGPGSFTGLRIGITTVKGLALVLKKPVVGICALDILAQNAKKIKTTKAESPPFQICPVIDAKQNKVYSCLYRAQNGKIIRKSGYMLLSIDELLRRLKGKILFLGDGVKLYREQIRKRRAIMPLFAEERLWYPKASQAVPIALERFRKGSFDDAQDLVPLYLYPKECQIRKVVGHRWQGKPTSYHLHPTT